MILSQRHLCVDTTVQHCSPHSPSCSFHKSVSAVSFLRRCIATLPSLPLTHFAHSENPPTLGDQGMGKIRDRKRQCDSLFPQLFSASIRPRTLLFLQTIRAARTEVSPLNSANASADSGKSIFLMPAKTESKEIQKPTLFRRHPSRSSLKLVGDFVLSPPLFSTASPSAQRRGGGGGGGGGGGDSEKSNESRQSTATPSSSSSPTPSPPTFSPPSSLSSSASCPLAHLSIWPSSASFFPLSLLSPAKTEKPRGKGGSGH